jgi:hypothetical protein
LGGKIRHGHWQSEQTVYLPHPKLKKIDRRKKNVPVINDKKIRESF